MTKILQKLAAATAGTILSFAAIEANPAQAALFNFSFDRSGSFSSYGQGFLYFNDATSGLTGIGREEASLSQLNGSFFFEYVNQRSLVVPQLVNFTSSNLLAPPVFTFESGSLIGMNLNLAPKTNIWVHPRGYGFTRVDKLFVTGANFRETQAESTLSLLCVPFAPFGYYNPDCTLVPITLTSESSGQINFVTRVPFQRPTSVPEPASLVGLSLLGLAFLLKQKTASSQG
ncbi:PEP-CTERM sorting domain-containing protein [Microseira wollei]|uniref:PEP-CTERM protein-sorting domain-containing protein n=1 Tax=Microseira wollei NIES-4236 TaxID=2530354 RepID=A0AAV3X007_9CYAN|nr:PEP-CTERM sorting domain-containing protein [Microseira wollei]GET35468.1 hypothetical protein MiSe_02100 [Microseira wollei NIES-4236]